MIHIHYLEPAGYDRWSRPLFRHRLTGQYFCVVADLEATLAEVRAGMEIYFKGDREGEPDHPVHVCCLPSIRCVTTSPNGMFHEGGVYPAFPLPTGTDNVLQVKDDLGHWRVMLWDDLTFIVENGGFGDVKRAHFEVLEDSQ